MPMANPTILEVKAIEQATVEIEGICAIKAPNRQALIESKKSVLAVGHPEPPYLTVTLQGYSATYQTEADLPYHSVPCPCGNPTHWLIKYEDESNA